MELEHNIAIRREKCRCGSPGHYDEITECSCGQFRHLNPHSADDEGREHAVLGHRLDVVERQLAIKFTIRHERV